MQERQAGLATGCVLRFAVFEQFPPADPQSAAAPSCETGSHNPQTSAAKTTGRRSAATAWRLTEPATAAAWQSSCSRARNSSESSGAKSTTTPTAKARLGVGKAQR